MRSDKITFNDTWTLVHDTEQCISIQNKLKEQGNTGVIQVYENGFNSRQVICTFTDTNRYKRLVYQLVDDHGELYNDPEPISSDLANILSQMFKFVDYPIKLEYDISEWENYKIIISRGRTREFKIFRNKITRIIDDELNQSIRISRMDLSISP